MTEKPSEIRYGFKTTNNDGVDYNITARTYSYDHATSYEINNNLNYIPVAFSVRGVVSINSKPVITTSDLPVGVVNAPYGFNFKALGAQNITWSASNLPSGLTLSSSGFLSGTPTTAGKFSCNVTAKNSAGSTSKSFTLEFFEIPAGFAPVPITSYQEEDVWEGKQYNFQLMALGTPPFTWELLGSTLRLPSGLTFSSNGRISGTPREASTGESDTLNTSVRVKNDSGISGASILFVNHYPPELQAGELNDAIINENYFVALLRHDVPYDRAAITWEISGNLPAGLSIDALYRSLSGIPTKTGKYKFTVTAKNIAGQSSESYTLNVIAPPEITTEKLPDATDGKYYSTKINVKSDIEYTLTLSGDLPEGLEFDSTKGTISGTPKEPCKNRELLITATNAAGSTGKIYSLTVKGFAPKLPNIGAITLTEDGFKIATTAGSQPITLKAYIDANTAKNIFYEVGNMSLDISSENYFSQYRWGFIFEAGQDDEGNPNGTGTFKFADNPHPDLYTNWPDVAYKNLPVVVVASNSQGVTTKTYKININGDSPEWYYTTNLYQTEGDIKAPETFTITAKAGTEIEPHEFLNYGSGPFRTQASMKSGKTYQKNGIYLDYVEDCTSVIVQGTPTAGKETKTQITLTGSNPSTKEKAKVKVIVVGQLAPQISSTADKLKKEIELGKNINLKPTVKGTKPITWSISDKDELEALGLSFDPSTGKISGTAKAPTVEDGEYSPKSFVLTATNSAGSANVTATIGVKGKKLKITTKEIKISTGENNNALKISSSLDNDSNANVTYSGTLPRGLELDSDGTINITGSPAPTSKSGTSVTITASNYGTKVTGKVKFIVTDPAPEFEDVDELEIYADKNKKVTKNIRVALTDESVTGANTKINWKVSKQPSKGSVKKSSGSNKNSTFTVTIPKGLYNRNKTDSSAINTSFTVTAENTVTKEKASKEISLVIYPCVDEAASSPIESEGLNEFENSSLELESKAQAQGQEIFVGAEGEKIRTVSGDYTIVATWPEISVDVSGLHKFHVSLSKDISVGAKLIWLARPENSLPSEDDEIVEFYNSSGDEIFTVPEDHKLEADAWLNKGIIYQPAIAVFE